MKWLAKRKDIDPRRIAVAGHSEGGAVAMLAAAREKKISSLVLIAAPGTLGRESDPRAAAARARLMKAPEAERQAKIELQQRIQAAVITDKGGNRFRRSCARRPIRPWFRSLLLFDPAKVMPKIKQPILIIQGDLDQQVFPHHADTLAELARARKKAPPVEVVHLPGYQSPAGAGRNRRSVGVRDAPGQDDHAGGRQGDRRLAEEVKSTTL